MTFEHPLLLVAALAPLAWVAWGWRGSERRAGLLLKALALSSVLVALAEPRLPVSETKMAVAVLADTSASVSEKDLERASELVTRIERSRGRHWTRVVPFAASTRNLEPDERNRTWKLKHTRGEAGRSTDLEGAIREAIAGLPEGFVPRVVLISDGRENQGSVARAVWQARITGVPIDTYALAGKPEPSLKLESVSLPSVAFTGERFPVDLVVRSPQRGSGTLEIRADGRLLGSRSISLDEGLSQIRVHASVSTTGAIDLVGVIRSADLGEIVFERAITLRRPRVLFISADPAAAEENFLKVLEATQFEVVRAGPSWSDELQDIQIVVFNNWDLESLPPARKAQVEDYVKRGGGLLVIGGERNVYSENKREEDPLDRALPAKVAPPRTPEGTSVVLIIDKSSSMEGRKMELARLAAIGVVENLRPIDWVGVLIFDNSFQWAVPIRKAEERTLIKRMIAGIIADGGTQIAPALTEAYRRILPTAGVYKHIVLLTDGISEEGDSMALAKEAALNRVTISTVGIGQDVNRAYLEKIADFAKGKSYFLTDPSGLEQILLRDVQEHTGSTSVEKPIRAVVAKAAEILEGIDLESAPPLKGYVKFISKPTADTILKVDDSDPLLARWQYGLGRAAVFTSDAKSRWAQSWLGWKGFDRFWANLLRDLLPHAQAGEVTAEYDSANGELVVDYRLAPHVEEPSAIPPIFVLGPRGFQRPIDVRKVAAGAFQGRVPIDGREGLFRIRPLEDSRPFPEVGLLRQREELNEFGSNELLLRQIATFTGGHFEPEPKQIFDPGDRSIASSLRLWPFFLGLAILFNLIELVLRKWRGVWQVLSPARAT